MICVSTNRYLMNEFRQGRMSAASVAKTAERWSDKNRPQVIEFQYDQATQRDLIVHNIPTFRFHGEAADNPMVLNATLLAWKTMAKEMSVRTFCNPDSAVKKWFHDTHRVLELLGAPTMTSMALAQLQVTTLKKIKDEEARRDLKKKGGKVSSRNITPQTPATSASTNSKYSQKSAREEMIALDPRDDWKE